MPTFVRTQTIEHPIGERGRLDLKVVSADVRIRSTEPATPAEAMPPGVEPAGPEPAGAERPGAEPAGSAGEATARVRVTYAIRAANEEEAERLFAEAQVRVGREPGSLVVEEPAGGGIGPGFGAAIGRLLTGRGAVELSLDVEVPPRAELRMEGVSADVRVSGLRGEQRYTTVSGDLYLTDEAGSLRINAISGDVTVRALQPVEVRAETVSGDLSLTAPRLEGLRINAVSGDVELEGAFAPRGDFRIDTVSGDLLVGLVGGAAFEVRGLSTDVRSDLAHRIEGRHDRRRVVVGGGGPSVVFSSMSGDLAIRRAHAVDGPPEAEPTPAVPGTVPEPMASHQLEVLRALERGEIDVDEANRRLSGLPTNG